MFIQLRLKTAEKVSRLSEVSPLIISVLIVFGVNILTAKYNAVINRTLVFILIMFSLRCIQHNLLRNTLAVVILIPVALDTTIQLYAWHNFRTEFSYGFALSILDTTPSEAKGMLGLYWRDCLSFVTLAAFFIYAANTGANLIPYRFHRYPPILLAITIIAFVGQAYLHQIRKSNVESLMQRVLSATPLSTGKVFMQAIQDISIMSDIGNNIPDYKITLTDTGIENYVLIIGESARAVNMGLYGYPRDTTPELIKQKHQLLLFQNAIAPAPVTIMAVPMAMTADSVNAHDPRKYSDNVINISNKAGYDTYWYSRQGKGGAHNNIITGIAMNAHQQEWVDHGYDEALLPLLQNALQKSGKKLIVLHLYGSHEPSCERFPESSTILAGESQADDCYDNSIRYTDTLMGNIFSALQNTRSSVMYFSDHALIRDPKRAVVYSHGGVTPPKEALHIPMFIWYSQLVDAKTKLTGDYRTQWSSDDLNTLAELWLGIHRQGAPINTLSSWLMNYDKTIFIMDTTGKQYEWRNVR
ncbi:phosphoethanolamine transferase [Citrobacter freundii]|jgi:glucan phosphoethanolaminetransferase (alkaline phosphatase superfamily)|uniref:phosphoethanolamine transferase n=1 Tax=Citrobacter sp. TBCS-14 TaxID=2576409 RepID=UPI001138BD1A|nr:MULTISPECIES: phosphoethanolamine transferase [Citrobacter]QLY69370.1 phosphoethanolamine transferase [Citrobacter freundii]QMJ03340.1 phosphoethanolamine transferase [Citrobacter freundii]QMJ12408.1 phosphoethanolamine transferase [Citrobacter freundii]TKV21959.1 phosphoethanolamine transferase [Citrobacter sp. TBCS-14]